MHDAIHLLPIAGVLFLGVASPGPSFALITSTAMSVSRRAGVLTAFGFAAASGTWALLAVAGLGIVLAQAPLIYTAVKVVGAAYLIWIGVKMLLGARKPLAIADGAHASGLAAIRRAYLVSMTNPKTIAFYGSIFTVMVPSSAPLWFYVAVVAIAAVISGAWYGGVALMFSHDIVRRTFAKAKTGIEAVMGVILIGLGGRLLLSR